jgi:hypothetical protein
LVHMLASRGAITIDVQAMPWTSVGGALFMWVSAVQIPGGKYYTADLC